MTEVPNSGQRDPAAPTRLLAPQAGARDILSQVWRGTAPLHITNHFRALRSELLLAVGERPEPQTAATILVTSALPGDGKTFVAASLARTFAHARDTQVTLLDFDLLRPSLTSFLDAGGLPGVGDCLNGHGDLRGVTCATDVPRLGFVPAGLRSDDSREAVAGSQADRILAQLRSAGQGTICFLDAPPIIPIVETAALASKVDLVVVVVRAGVTPRAAVEDAIGRLGPNAKPCIVLNAVSGTALGRNYDYGYADYAPHAQD